MVDQHGTVVEYSADSFQNQIVSLASSENNLNDRISQNGMTALIQSLSEGCLAQAEDLLVAGVDVEAADSQGFTALHYASFFGFCALI